MGDLTGIIFIVIMVVGGIFIGLFYLNRWALKRMDQQQETIARSKQTVSIFVIDKKKEKAENANLPKQVMEQLPKYYRFFKMHLVRAKIGPQIMTLMCDKKVFNALPVKKNVKVDLAGIYIVSMKGMKTDEELKEMKRARKEKEKLTKKENKEKK